MAGSHVIVRTKDGELPDRTFEEAGPPGRLVLQRTLCSQGRDRLYPEKACEKTCRCETRFRCLLHQLFSHGFSGYFGSERGYGVITIQQKTFLCSRISSRPDTCISASICPEKFFCKHRKFFLLNIRTPLRYMLTNKNRKTILFRSPVFSSLPVQ